MFLLPLLLQAAPLVRYDELPNPPRENVQACVAEFDRLQSFVSYFKSKVHERELDRGGRLTWSQANDIRYAADLTARPYLERLRRISYTGSVKICRITADEGLHAVADKVVLPVFGK